MAYSKSYHEEVVQYYQYNMKSFYADVGGLLGLFLGVSMLSFYDFLVASAAYVWKYVSIWRTKRKSLHNGAIL